MRILKALQFATGFGVARTLLFVAPIILANLLPLDRYGQFELAQAYAALGALVAGLGLASTVPLIRLENDIEGRWDSLLLLIALLGGSCLGMALLMALWFGAFYVVPVLVCLMMGALMLQGFWATSLKADGRSTRAVFVEAGFWSVAVLGAGLIALSEDRLAQATIPLVLLTYGLGLLVLTFIQFRHHRMENSSSAVTMAALAQNVMLGLPLMLTNVLTVAISSSGRLVLGQTSGVELVGLYAVLFRSTTVPLVGHQVLIIGFFREIFSWSDDILRARAPLIVFGVTTMVMAFWLLEPVLSFLLGQRFTEIFEAYRIEGLILLVQTLLWSAIALNDLINSRLQIAWRVTWATAPALALGLGALWHWTLMRANTLDSGEILYSFIVAHFALTAIFYLAQCIASFRLGHSFFRLWFTVAGCTIGAGGLILLGEYLR